MEAPTELLQLVGRLHPLALHFPIGLFAAVGVLELLAWWGADRSAPAPDRARANDVLVPLLALSAAVSAGLGIALARGGGYDETLLFRHRWLGVGVALLSLTAAALWRAQRRRPASRLRAGYRATLALLLLVIAAAGHHGTALTHGSGYLARLLPRWLSGGPPARDAAPAVRGADFASALLPVFESRCFECHGPEKQESGLRLDSREAMLTGGDSGQPALVPGDALASRLVRFITLPRDHEQVMPPTGNPKLTPAQTLAIIDWIDRGAPWSHFARALGGGVPRAPDDAVAALRTLGARVVPLSRDVPLLQVDFRPVADRLVDAQLEALLPLSRQVTWLNLAGARVGEAGLRSVGRLENLTRLHLERSGVGDAALRELRGLAQLRYLNLYGTAVSDAGLEHLEGLERLEQLYLWRTAATPRGAARLRGLLPALAVDLGADGETS